MRIDRIRVDGFGKLAGLDTGGDPLPGLVVVLGPNEAGKSTLFAFLTTIFYGFQPATRETNPHTPWGSAEAAGRVRLRLGDGLPAEVERRLRSQPSARLSVGGTVRELRNQALPWVEHVPRAVFRQVFAITLRELAGLDTETWARIQDKVVGSMGATDLRSPRSVAEALEAEAGEVWRPNRRGNQKLRDLQAEMRSLRLRRTAAHERDARLRSLAGEREAVAERASVVRSERHALRAEIERVHTLIPVERQLTRIAALRAEGGRRDLLDSLPEDPLERLTSLEAERTMTCTRLKALDEELSDLQSVVSAYDDDARRLVGRRADVVHWIARSAACDADRAIARDGSAHLVGVEARLDTASEPLLAPGWREQHERISRVPIAVLEDRLARAAQHAHPVTEPRGMTAALALVALVGMALLLWGVLGGGVLPIALGATLVSVAVAAGMALGLRQARTRAARAGARPAEDDPLLGGVRLHPARRGDLTPSVLAELARVQDLLAERAGHTRAAAAARARHEQVDAAVAALARELGRAASTGTAATCATLEAELRDADRRREAAESAEREARRLLRERQALGAKLSGLASSIAVLEAAGARFAPDQPRRGLELARTRLAAHQRADRLEEEVERAYPDRADLETQIRALMEERASGRATDPPGVESSSLKARLEELEQETELLLRRSEAIEVEARQLREAETVDAVDGEIATLKELEERLSRERDRKLVLARILREADRRFREEHQPDLLRRAGSYLARLTSGRYDRMVVDEADGAHPFRLVGPGLPAPVTLAAPVSTGTLEQAYLALRLAIVDHLDQGGERLPLFVDEVFVNWDAERRTRGIEVLANLAATRQIFVFTCHPDMAAELVSRGGRLIPLDRGG